MNETNVIRTVFQHRKLTLDGTGLKLDLKLGTSLPHAEDKYHVLLDYNDHEEQSQITLAQTEIENRKEHPTLLPEEDEEYISQRVDLIARIESELIKTRDVYEYFEFDAVLAEFKNEEKAQIILRVLESTGIWWIQRFNDLDKYRITLSPYVEEEK